MLSLQPSCPRRVNISYSTSVIHRVNWIKKNRVSYDKWEHIRDGGCPNHDGDRKTFEVICRYARFDISVKNEKV
jgi:hypothetical protein